MFVYNYCINFVHSLIRIRYTIKPVFLYFSNTFLTFAFQLEIENRLILFDFTKW